MSDTPLQKFLANTSKSNYTPKPTQQEYNPLFSSKFKPDNKGFGEPYMLSRPGDISLYEDRLGKGLFRFEDLPERLAQNQSVADRLGNAPIRLGLTFATKTLEGPGFIVGGIGSLITGDINTMTDNAWVNFFEDVETNIKDNLVPIYKTNAYKDGSIWQQMGTASFWADDVVDGVAFMASAFVPGMAFTKFFSTGAKLAGGYGKIAKGFSRALKAEKLGKAYSIPKGMSVAEILSKPVGEVAESTVKAALNLKSLANKLDVAQVTLLSTTMEAGFEARDSQKQVEASLREKYPNMSEAEIKDRSAEAAKETYWKNMGALMLSNYVEASALMKVFKPSRFANLAKTAPLSLKKQIGIGVYNAAKTAAVEGGWEENIQLAIQNYQEDKAFGSKEKAAKGLVNNWFENWSTDEGQKNIALGMIIGAIPGGVGGVRKAKGEQQRRANLDKIIKDGIAQFKGGVNDFYKKEVVNGEERTVIKNGKPVYDFAKIESAFKSEMKDKNLAVAEMKAIIEGDQQTVDYIKHIRFNRMAYNYLGEAGGLEALNDQLDLIAKDVEETDGYNPFPEFDAEGNAVDIQTSIGNLKNQALKLQGLYNNVSQRHAGFIQAKTATERFVAEELQFNQYIEAANQLIIQERIDSVNSDLSSLQLELDKIKDNLSEGQKMPTDTPIHNQIGKKQTELRQLNEVLKKSYDNFAQLISKETYESRLTEANKNQAEFDKKVKEKREAEAKAKKEAKQNKAKKDGNKAAKPEQTDNRGVEEPEGTTGTESRGNQDTTTTKDITKEIDEGIKIRERNIREEKENAKDIEDWVNEQLNRDEVKDNDDLIDKLNEFKKDAISYLRGLNKTPGTTATEENVPTATATDRENQLVNKVEKTNKRKFKYLPNFTSTPAYEKEAEEYLKQLPIEDADDFEFAIASIAHVKDEPLYNLLATRLIQQFLNLDITSLSPEDLLDDNKRQAARRRGRTVKNAESLDDIEGLTIVGNKIEYGHDAFAYLNRDYDIVLRKSVTEDGIEITSLGRTNKDNKILGYIRLLDDTIYKEGTPIHFEIDYDLSYKNDDGEIVTFEDLKSKEGEDTQGYSIGYTPIAIKDDEGNTIAHVHDGDWITEDSVYGVKGEGVTREDVEAAIEADRQALLELRKYILEQILDGRTVRSEIKERNIGKLISNKQGYQDTNKSLPDKELQIVIARGGKYWLNRQKEFTDQLHESGFIEEPIDGVAYIMIPVREGIYTPFPIENKKLGDLTKDGNNVYIDSIVEMLGSYLNGEVNEELANLGYNTNNRNDIIRYVNEFIYNYNSNKLSEGESLRNFLTRLEGTEVSLFRMSPRLIEFGNSPMSNYNRISLDQSGNIQEIETFKGKVRVRVNPESKNFEATKQLFLSNLREHLKNVNIRFDMNKLNSEGAYRLPIYVNGSFKLGSTTFPYTNYNSFVKAHSTTNILSINIGTKAKPKYVYTIQPVIRFENPTNRIMTQPIKKDEEDNKLPEDYGEMPTSFSPDTKIDDVKYQNNTGQTDEEYVASEKTIRDLAARIADRIGIPVRFISDRTQKYKGKIDSNIAYINLAYATLDTPIHEILGHPIIRAIKNRSIKNLTIEEQEDKYGLLTSSGDPGIVYTIWEANKGSKEIFDTKIEAENYIQSLKNNNILYQNLLKELEYGKGKEVLDRIKRDYTYKYNIEEGNFELGNFRLKSNEYGARYYNTKEEAERDFEKYGIKYTLEEQQEEAIVELLGLYTADRLNNISDGKLISLLKRLLKEMKAFMRSLFGQKEINIDELPDNMTLGDIADLLAYSNSKLILPGNEVVYTTPDNQTFKTYQEASKHISELAKSVEDIDLSTITSIKDVRIETIEDIINKKEKLLYIWKDGDQYRRIVFRDNKWYNESGYDINNPNFITEYSIDDVKEAIDVYNAIKGDLISFISKNKEYEQSKEIIEEWKKINNIQYDPEEVYSRGQGFYSVVGAYSDFDVDLMFQNLLAHIEDNKKAGGEFTISAFTKPVDKKLNHLEGNGGKIRFKIFPKSEDIKWAANSDVYSGSVWDASEKVSKDSKSEIIGVSYTKSPSLNNVNSVQPNLASIIDDLAHHHNELGINLTGNNFRLEYDNDIPYSTKKIIDSVNSILDEKYGKLVKPKIEKGKKQSILIDNSLSENERSGVISYSSDYDGGYFLDTIYGYERKGYAHGNKISYFKVQKILKTVYPNSDVTIQPITKKVLVDGKDVIGYPGLKYQTSDKIEKEVLGIQPTQTKETLKESIASVKDKLVNKYDEIANVINNIQQNENNKFVILDEYYNPISPEFNTKLEAENYFKNNISKKEYTSQALINTKIAALKNVAKKYPRSLIRSEVRQIRDNGEYRSSDLFIGEELPFQKLRGNSIYTADPLPLRGNEALYKHYNLLTKDGKIKTVKLNDNTKKWVATLNLSPNYSFSVRPTPGGYKIFILDKIVNLSADIHEEDNIDFLKFINDNVLINGVTHEQQKAVIDGIISQIYQEVYKSKTKSISEVMVDWFSMFEKWQAAYKKKGIEKGEDLMSNLLDNWRVVTKFVNDRLAKLTDNRYYEEAEDLDQFEDFRTYFEKTRFDDEASLFIDTKTSLSSEMKMFLYNIRDRKPDGSLKTSMFNREVLVPFDDVYNTLVSILSNGLASYETKIDILKANQNRLPFIKDVIEQLEAADDRIKNQFTVAMNKHYVRMKSLFYGYDKKGVSVVSDQSNKTANVDVLLDSWINNFKSLQYIIYDEEGNTKFDIQKFDDFNAAYDKLNEKINVENLMQFFNSLGINLSIETIDEIVNNGLGKAKGRHLLKAGNGVIGNIKRDIDDAIKNKLTFEESKIFKDSTIKELAKLDSNFTVSIYSNSFTRGDNKVVYAFGNNRYIIERFNMFKSHPDIEEIRSLFNSAFTKNSSWLNLMYNKDTAKRKFNTFTDHFNYFYVDTLKKFKSKKALVSKQMNKADLEAYMLGQLINKGFTENNARIINLLYPTLSDGAIALGITAEGVDISFNTDRQLDVKTLDKVFNAVIRPEIDRILEVQAGEGLKNIKGYNKGGVRFNFIPILNEVEELWNEDGTLKSITNTDGSINYDLYDTYLNSLRTHIKNQVREKQEEWLDYGIVQKTKKGNKFVLADKDYVSNYASANKNISTIRYAAYDMVVNYMIGYANMFQLFIGDPALYYTAGDNNMITSANTFINIGKRLSGDKTPGLDIAYDKENPNVIYVPIKDQEVSATDTTLLKKLGIDWKTFKSTDAQEYTTLREGAYVKYRQGLMSKGLYDIIDRVVTDNVGKGNFDYIAELETEISDYGLTEEYNKVINQPIKPQYNNLYKGRKLFVKSSSFELNPRVTNELEIDKLRKVAEKLEYDKKVFVRLPFSSAIKVGNIENPINIFNSDGTVKDTIEISDEQYIVTPRLGFRIPQEVPFDPDKTKIGIGTQESKLQFLNILNESIQYNGKSVKGSALRDRSNEIYGELYKIEKRKFIKSLYTDGKLDIKKVRDTLVKEAKTRDWGINDLQNLQVIESEGQTRFIHPLFLNSSSIRIEALFTSIVQNRVNKLKLKGRSSILGSQAGFETKILEGAEGQEYINSHKNSIIFTDAFTGKLKGFRLEDGKLAPAQVLVSNKLTDINGRVLNLRDQDAEGNYKYLKIVGNQLMIDYDKIDRKTLISFGFRIPTAAQNSMAAIEIVGFLPETEGDLIIASQDFVAQMGSDFDIDKLYSYMYNTGVIDGKVVALDSSHRDILFNYKIYSLLETEDEKKEYKQLISDLVTINADIKDILEERENDWYHLDQNRENYFKDRKENVKAIQEAIALEDEIYKSLDALKETINLRNQQLSELEAFKEQIEYHLSGNKDALNDLSKLYGVDNILEASRDDEETLHNMIDSANQKEQDLIDRLTRIQKSIDTFKEENKDLWNKERESINIRNKLGRDYTVMFNNAITKQKEALDKLSTFKFNIKEERFNPYSTKEELQNELLDIKLAIMTSSNETVQKQILAETSYGFLENIAKTIIDIKQARLDDFAPLSSKYQRDKYIDAQSSTGIMIGIKANDNTFIGLSQGRDVSQLYNGKRIVVNIGGKQSTFISDETSTTGEYKSVTNGYYLQSALDNEKVQILAAINSNPLTSAFERFLTLHGFSKEIPLMTAQESIVDYVDRMRNLNSSLNNLSYDQRRDEALDYITSKYGALKEGAYLNYLPKLTVNKLFSLLKETDTSSVEYKSYQAAIFQAFLAFDKLGNDILKLEQSLNHDSKGLGKSILETILKQDQAVANIENTNFANNVSLFGEIKDYGELIDLYETDKGIEDAGYEYLYTDKYTNSIYLKPTTISGYSLMYGVVLNNNTWSEFFPYSKPKFKEILREATSLSRLSDTNLKTTLRIQSKFVSQLKSYLYSNPELWNLDSIENKRNELLYDGILNGKVYWKSLARKVLMAKKGTTNEFLKRLTVDIGSDVKPSRVIYDNVGLNNLDDSHVYAAFVDLFVNPQPIGEINNEDYTTRDLFKELVEYAYLTGGDTKFVQFTKFILPNYLTRIGFSERVREVNYDHEDTYGLNPDANKDATQVSHIVKQIYQHDSSDLEHPNKYSIISNDTSNPITATAISVPVEGNDNIWRTSVNIAEETDINPVAMIRVNFPETDIEAIFQLYSYDKNKSAIYKRVANLGSYGISEFIYGESDVLSGTPSNNKGVKIVSPARRPVTNSNKTIKNERKTTTLGVYGLDDNSIYFEDNRSSEQMIKDALETIIKDSDNELYKLVAKEYLDNADLGSTTILIDRGLAAKGSITRSVKDGKRIETVISFNPSKAKTKQSAEELIMHELTHAFVSDNLYNPKTPEHREAITRLEGFMNEVINKFGKDKVETFREKFNKEKILKTPTDKKYYSVYDLDEFISAVIYNEDIQEILDSQEYFKQGRTFLRELWDRILNLLAKAGVITRNSKLDAALESILELSSKPPKTKISHSSVKLSADRTTIGTISLNIIEDWVQEGTASTTIRSDSYHKSFYRGDGWYKTNKGNTVNIKYKGKVQKVGDRIVGYNISYTLDEFAKAEGFGDWNNFVDKSKYSGIDLQNGKKVNLYFISKNEIQEDTGIETQLPLFAPDEQSYKFTSKEELDNRINALKRSRKDLGNKAVKLINIQLVKIKEIDRKLNTLDRLLLDAETDQERKNINVQILNTYQYLARIVGEAEDMSKVETFDDVLAYAEEDLTEIEDILAGDLSSDDINRIDEIMGFWTNSIEYFFSESEQKGINTTLDKFHLIQGKASRLDSILTDVKRNYMEDWMENRGFAETNIKKMMDKQQDISVATSEFLNIGRTDNPLLSVFFNEYKRADIESKEELDDMIRELDYLIGKVRPIIGNDWDKFYQTREDGTLTGGFVMKYSQEYFDKRNQLYYKAIATNKNKDWERYFDFKKDYEIVLDMRYLLPDANLWKEEDTIKPENITDETIAKYRARVIDHIGEHHFNKLLSRLESKKLKYEEAREAAIEDIKDKYYSENGTIDQEQIDILVSRWEKENSPYWFAKRMKEEAPMYYKDNLGNRVYMKNYGYQYTYTVPKKYVKIRQKDGTIVTKDTGFYDAKFEEIESNSTLLEFYERMVDIMSQLNKYLPRDIRENIKFNTIPALEKSVLDVFKDGGSKLAITKIWDNIKRDISSVPSSNISNAIVPPNAAKVNKELRPKFLADNKSKIQRLVDIRKAEYLLKHKEEASVEDIKKFYREATDEVVRNNSSDLGKIIKAYATAVMAFKTHSKLEPQLRIIDSIIQESKEVQRTKKGEVIVGTEGTRYKTKEESFPHLKASWNHFYNWWYGDEKKEWGVIRDKEGQPKRVYSKEEKEMKLFFEDSLQRLVQDQAGLEARYNNFEINEEEYSRLKGVYAQQINSIQNRLDSLGREKFASKYGLMVLKAIGLRGLGWNLFSPVTNMGQGFIVNYTEAADGRIFNTNELNIGYKKVLHSILRNFGFNSKWVTTNEALKIRSLMDRFHILADQSDGLYDGGLEEFLTGRLKALTPYAGQERSEYVNQAPVMIAIMHRIKVKDKAGKERFLYDAFDINGNWREDTFDINQDWINVKGSGKNAKVNTIIKIQDTIDRLHGDYRNPLKVKEEVVKKSPTTFRTWMFEGYANKYEKEKYNVNADINIGGRYKSWLKVGRGLQDETTGEYRPGFANIGHAIVQVFKTQFGFNSDFDGRYDEVTAANMRKNVRELLILMDLISLGGIMMLITGKDDDDKKRSDFIALNYFINVGFRLKSDILFYTTPKEFTKLNKNIIPAMRYIIDIGEWIDAMVRLIAGDDEIKTGVYAGQSRATRETMQMFPFTVQLYRLFSITHQIESK